MNMQTSFIKASPCLERRDSSLAAGRSACALLFGERVHSRHLQNLLAAFFLCFLFGNGALHAQAVSGTIVGTVTDSGGAVVSNAQVSIILTGQSALHASVTNESGNFSEPNLPAGIYTVTVAAPGFKKEVRENIVLNTDTTTRVDIALDAGSVTETVVVTTALPALQTDHADISTQIEQRQIADLPLSSGNSFQSLLNTVPGMAPVVFNSSQFFNANNDLSANSKRSILLRQSLPD